MSQALSGMFIVGAFMGRERGNGTNREIPEEIGKIPEKRESPKSTERDQSGRTSPNRETPRLKATPSTGP